jgi:predicted acylesterase/phospholipase RssA
LNSGSVRRTVRPDRQVKQRAHLVLGAGGVRCLAYVGALQQLELEGYEFATVSTCSAATFVGALYCAGIPPDDIRTTALELDLRELAGDVRWPRLRRLWTLRSWPYALYREPGMLRVFRRILHEHGLDPDPTLGTLRTPMNTAAVDVASARMLVYASETNPTLHVAELLRIATAIPLMYAPHERAGREVLDAALASYTPIWLATGQREELPIVALRVPPVLSGGRRQLGSWLRDVLASGIASRDTFDLERLPDVTVVDVPSRFSAFDFGLSAVETAELIDGGRVAVADHLEREDERGVDSAPPADDDDRAEREAGRLFQRHLDRAARRRTPVVFISYAREDREWVERLRAKLAPLIVDKAVTVWDDSYIPSGANWDTSIHDAILRARVAVLIVSRHFLASRYSIETELALLREQLSAGASASTGSASTARFPRIPSGPSRRPTIRRSRSGSSINRPWTRRSVASLATSKPSSAVSAATRRSRGLDSRAMAVTAPSHQARFLCCRRAVGSSATKCATHTHAGP